MSQAEWRRSTTRRGRSTTRPSTCETILRRAAATGVRTASIAKLLLWFSTSVRARECPSAAGRRAALSGAAAIAARRCRSSPLWRFYPREAWQLLAKSATQLFLMARLERVRRRIEADPDRKSYRAPGADAGRRGRHGRARPLQPERRGAAGGDPCPPCRRTDAQPHLKGGPPARRTVDRRRPVARRAYPGQLLPLVHAAVSPERGTRLLSR